MAKRANLLIDKPSRLHNLSYLLLGYYISTVVTYTLELPLEQKLLLIGTFGSFIGALVYYIKPIEQVMMGIIRLGKKIENGLCHLTTNSQLQL